MICQSYLNKAEIIWLNKYLAKQYFGYLMIRDNSLEKTLMLEKTEGKRTKGQQRMIWLDRITDSMDVNFSKLQSKLMCSSPWDCRVRHDLVTEQQ